VDPAFYKVRGINPIQAVEQTLDDAGRLAYATTYPSRPTIIAESYVQVIGESTGAESVRHIAKDSANPLDRYVWIDSGGVIDVFIRVRNSHGTNIVNTAHSFDFRPELWSGQFSEDQDDSDVVFTISNASSPSSVTEYLSLSGSYVVPSSGYWTMRIIAFSVVSVVSAGQTMGHLQDLGISAQPILFATSVRLPASVPYVTRFVACPEILNDRSIFEETRVTALSVLVQNQSISFAKGGTVFALTVSTGGDEQVPLRSFGTFTSMARPPDGYTGALEKGLYSYRRPSAGDVQFRSYATSQVGLPGPWTAKYSSPVFWLDKEEPINLFVLQAPPVTGVTTDASQENQKCSFRD
jgi:hypothetical protein